MARITTNDPQNAFAANDLAVATDLLNRSTYFHNTLSTFLLASTSRLNESRPNHHRPVTFFASSFRTGATLDMTGLVT